MHLEREITLEELDWAISQCPRDKAPGPDGLNMKSIKLMWPHLKGKNVGLYSRVANGNQFIIYSPYS